MFFRKSKVSTHPGLRNYMATKLTNNPMTLTPLRVLINTTMSCQPCIFITCPEGGDKVTSHCAITAARDLLIWPGTEEMASVSPIHIWGNWGSEKLMILGHTATVVKPRFRLRACWLALTLKFSLLKHRATYSPHYWFRFAVTSTCRPRFIPTHKKSCTYTYTEQCPLLNPHS